MKKLIQLIALVAWTSACTHQERKQTNTPENQPDTEQTSAEPAQFAKGTFGYDVAFLQKHQPTIVLTGADSTAQVAVCPAYQGRVMTSTATGSGGNSFGWLNYDLIASGKFAPHINAFGGEDRFWLGPEGGQYAIFFRKGDTFDLDHWQTPAPIDTEAYDVVSRTKDHVQFRKRFTLTNYSGATFALQVDRTVKMLSPDEIQTLTGKPVSSSLKVVGFQSENTITNTGREAWKPSTGLLSIWILGMFKHSPGITIVIPYENKGSGTVVKDDYFGKVPAERLKVSPKAVFFKGDGQYRSKIGIPPGRAKSILGSYDADRKVLTLVQYTLPTGKQSYVNSAWELQKEPYRGDVVNSYNDGPAQPGAKPFGPFYELETSSPAASLKPQESLSHLHRTIHLQGSEAELNALAQQVLGITLEEVKQAF